MPVHGVPWAARHEATCRYWGDTLPASPPGPCTHWPMGHVFREGFLGYLYSHFTYNPNSKTEKKNGGQVHVGHRQRSTLSTSSSLKAGKGGLFSSQRLVLTTSQVRSPARGQTLLPTGLSDGSE